jgi:hypothetical protein
MKANMIAPAGAVACVVWGLLYLQATFMVFPIGKESGSNVLANDFVLDTVKSGQPVA